VRGGERATSKVWEGAQGLEWELPSPPPYHSWTTPPSISELEHGAPVHETHG
jgi:cytochrome c oxidase subunit 1